MTNKQLKDVLSKYPDDCEVVIESDINYDECDIARIRAEYEYGDNFEVPILTLEYQKRNESLVL